MKINHNVCLFKNVPFKKQEYYQYRIPGIVVTKKNTVLTYFEARTKFGDWATIDIKLMRSTDEGKTFSAPLCLVNGSKTKNTVNNPVMIVGNDNTIHFFYCVEYGVKSKGGGVFYSKSIDDGLTFSSPTDISEVFLPLNANVIAIGPGHGICTKNNAIMCAVWFVPKEKSKSETCHFPSYVTTLYSLDNGKSFNVGETIKSDIKSLNESELLELSDGKIMINMRAPHEGCRAISLSDSGYDNWCEVYKDKALTDPTCFAGITKTQAGTIFFVNCCHNKKRRLLTLKKSIDDGKTFKREMLVFKGTAGYSDIASDDKGNLYVAYEVKSGKSYYVAQISEK
ncbi:MAG: sialidase family protein [Oscillospiraceae bacterium]